MAVKAKMVCTKVISFADKSIQAELNAVLGDSEENKSFSKFTPYANLNIIINNPEAVKQFEAGKEYYLTLEET